MWLSAAARIRIMVGIEKWTRPTRTPRSVNSIGTGHVMTVLPSTRIHAYVRTIAPVKNGASVRTRIVDRTRRDGVRASAYATGYAATSVSKVVSALRTMVSRIVARY